MFEPSAPLILFIALTFLLAGFVKGVVGLGLPTIAVGLLGLSMPPLQAAALLIAPSVVTNIWQLTGGSRFTALLHRLWPMLLGIFIGTLAASWLLGSQPLHYATSVLGIALVAYALLGLGKVHFQVTPATEHWLAPVIGALTGAVTAVTGVFVIPSVPYLQALGLQKEELIQALGLSFMASTLALAISLMHSDTLQQGPLFGASLLALLPALGGMFLGQWLRQRISQERFRQWFFCGLLLLGANLALRF
ncbi:sulfite exporter TauE/SafE family protein [Pseudomonas cavernicola]|uniref:Probable membrane transporter protein n=1 Tax=Pseudomonas cavernicola TaxID=2320866 RepID=A0A418XLP1_9PSED|nr:sulfite exporter TauE/SafE family protein [Pseudomonas cavernicola]RJG13365.1 sulfite exporter TauE/SafE family protein [Pseudomonas cavernicola]